MGRSFMKTHGIQETEDNFETSLDLAVDDLPLRDKRLWMATWGMFEMMLDRIEKLEKRVRELESEVGNG